MRSDVTYDCVAEFSLTATNGYRVTVSGEPGFKNADVEIAVEGHGATADYSVPGKVTATSIRASFGRLGRVSVRFHPSGGERRVRLPRKCQSERPPVVSSRLGSFRGTISFRGEGGYTEVSAHHAKGGVGDPLATAGGKPACQAPESSVDREREFESVSLVGSSPSSGITLTVGHIFGSLPPLTAPAEPLPPPNDRYLFFAIGSEQIGRVTILRGAQAIGGSEDFVFDPGLKTATVTPPYPFSGTGSLVRNPDGSVSWTGTLAVPLPGLGTAELTGGKAELAPLATLLQKFEEEEKLRAPS